MSLRTRSIWPACTAAGKILVAKTSTAVDDNSRILVIIQVQLFATAQAKILFVSLKVNKLLDMRYMNKLKKRYKVIQSVDFARVSKDKLSSRLLSSTVYRLRNAVRSLTALSSGLNRVNDGSERKDTANSWLIFTLLDLLSTRPGSPLGKFEKLRFPVTSFE